MKVLVLNGSPKNEKSITLQTVKYLEIKYPEDSFTYEHVGTGEKVLERRFIEITEKIKEHDMVLFSYPVYTFLAPAQLHRFVEMLKASGETFTGKYMTQITTSKHFYDITAHAFMEENAKDLGFTVLEGLSQDMEDLPKKEGQKQVVDFWEMIHRKTGNLHRCEDNTEIATHDTKKANCDTDVAAGDIEKRTEEAHKITLLCDLTEEDTSLSQMIDEFVEVFPGKVNLYNLRDVEIKGGCLGCLKCAATGKCIYNDGFDVFLREKVQASMGIVYAFTIKDHSMGSRFKLFDDRQFCNGHRTVTMGQPVGYIISGNLSCEHNLMTVLTARAQVGGNYLTGILSDEPKSTVTALELAESMIFSIDRKYQPPKNFWGVGGMRIFRDLIYQMQGLMKLDHKFFKANNQYDFPQKKKGTIFAMYLVGTLFSNPKLMKKMGPKIDEGMLSPYTKVLDEARKGTNGFKSS